MRNPKRIPKIMKELEEFWKQNPDWRLGQVISNLNHEIMGNNDPFYVEDDDLLEILRRKNAKECICKNCGKTFTIYSRIDKYYCDNPSPQNPKKTCAEIGPKLVCQQRYHNEDDWYSWYRKTYQMVQGRVRRSPEKYKSKLFEDFKQDTKQWIEDVKKGRKTSSEFIQWLKQYREKLHIKEIKHKKEESKKLSYEDKIMSKLTEKDLEV